MEIDFEEIIVDNLNHVNCCLNNVFGYDTKINADRVIEAKAVVAQTLQLIHLKNTKINKETDNKPDKL